VQCRITEITKTLYYPTKHPEDAMGKLYYFQAPTFSINAEGETAPKLGSIFYSLNRLTGPLNQSESVVVPANLKNSTSITSYNEMVNKGLMVAAGLSTNLVQGLAGSADIMYGFAKGKKEIYTCKTLETSEFEPTEQFIADSIAASSSVRATLRNALPGRKRVYMITGLKIATGLTTSTSKTTLHGPILRAGVDATALGVPASAGPEIEFATTSTHTVSQGRSENKVVFAYRVVRITQKRDGEARWRYMSGGKYSVDDDDSEDEEVAGSFDIEPLEEDDVAADFPDSVRFQCL